MKLRNATECDKNRIIEIYERAKKQAFCLWDEGYPTEKEIDWDLQNRNLYVLVNDEIIIGCISLETNSELDELRCWEEQDAREFTRVVIDYDYQGRGYAKLMVEEIEKILLEQNCKAIHILAGVDNIPACKTYEKLGYSFKESVFAYGHQYYPCEKILSYQKGKLTNKEKL